MKFTIAAAVSALITATLASGAAQAHEAAIHTHQSTQSAAAAASMTEARKALSAYLAACGARDAQGIARTTTGDAEIEYATDAPGRYLAVDLNSVDSCWISAAEEIWIYPTPVADTVFVNLVEATGGDFDAHKAQHLALVKINAGRISQIRDFSTPLGTTTLVDNAHGAAGAGK